MSPPITACAAFADDISALIDRELPAERAQRLTDHIHDCSGCSDFADGLRRLSVLHRQVAAPIDESLLARLDPGGIFRGVMTELVSDRTDALARLFYEIGRAYVIAGNRELSDERRRSVIAYTPTRDPRAAEHQAKALLRDAEEIEVQAETARPSLFKRGRKLFERPASRRSGVLERGRHFLEEALALTPTFDEARLYLGFLFGVLGRHERARIEFRKVYAGSGRPVHKLMALQSLGSVYEMSGDYSQAAECYGQVVEHEAAGAEPRLFPSFLNLPVSCAKAGRAHESVRHFVDLVTRFPQRVTQIRGLLSRKQSFAAMLAQDAGLADDLRRSVPQLFAA